jgi:anti-sigma-K factor RskA
MNEPHAMGCDELADVAAELALGVLTGRERAEALAHLEQCPACRENVRQLTTTGEELLELLPTMEPPAGFETRVMDRLGLTPAAAHPDTTAPRHVRQPGRTRRLLTVAAVVAGIVVAGVGGWGLHAATSTPATSPLSSAALLTASHQNAGTIYVYNGASRWLYMSVDMPSGDGTVVCQLVSADGHVTTFGSFRLTHGYGYWGSPEPSAAGQPAAARLIGPNGAVLATATLPAS